MLLVLVNVIRFFLLVMAYKWCQRHRKGPSTKDDRQMGSGVVLKFWTFPDEGGGGGGGWFVKVRTSENF